MNIKEIDKYIVPFDTFPLSWRFTDRKYDKLSISYLKELKPFNQDVSLFFDDLIRENNIHNEFPFNRDIYRNIDSVKVLSDNDKEITTWLCNRDLSPEDLVYLSWDNETSLKAKWKIVIEYWDSIYYPGSDDLTIFDESMKWMILFFHENEIYWGSK